MSLPLLTLVIALGAEPIPPDKAAQVERDQQKAQKAVDAKYGNKKLTELSQDERRQLTKDRAEAEAQVLDKHGLDAKQWARESLKKDRAQYAEGKERVKALLEKEKAEAEAAEKAKQAGTGEVQVQKGFSDENPVVLEEQQGDKPLVEEGLPSDVAADEAAAAEQDRLEGGADSEPSKPAPAPAAKGKGRGRGR